MPSCSLLRLTALSLIVAMVTACDALHANICDIYENQSLCNNKLHFEEIAQITTSPDITKRSFLGVLDGGYLISAEQTASINGYTYGKFTEWHLINKILSKSTACTHCPSTTFIIFENDDFYVSGNSFYRITHQQNKKISSVGTWSSGQQWTANDVEIEFGVRPSVSFDGTIFSYAIRNNDNSCSPQVLIDKTTITKAGIDSCTDRSIAIANIEPSRSGIYYELVQFSSHGLLRIDSLSNFDVGRLTNEINYAFSKQSSSGLIDLVVSDFDNDGHPEVLHLRDKLIYAITITNGTSDSERKLQPWLNPIMDLSKEAADEKIISLRAVDINGDSLPDLAIETDKRVLFYVNQAQ
jgi:hypothetical protein